MTIHLLGIPGSLRKASTNTGLLRACQANLPADCAMELADLSGVPFFNADLPGPPPEVEAFFEQLKQADALVMASPEYNFSLAPALKNALDWASRYPDNALLKGKAAAVLSAGGGMGGARAQYHLRQVGVYLDLHFVNKPEVFARAFGGAFADNGDLLDEKVTANVADLMAALVGLAKALKR